MNAPRSARNVLLVEGGEDKRVIPFLLDAHIRWGEEKSEWPAMIIEEGCVENILKDHVISSHFKARDLQALGIVIDGNADPQSRWQSVRRLCTEIDPRFPAVLAPHGVIHASPRGKRLGVWIMPDNGAVGMLETFLSTLGPTEQPLWQFAIDSTKRAHVEHNAPWREVHRDKAQLHAWLAWQDPPGCQLHIAVLEQFFKAESPKAAAFVEWFIKLFDLDDLRRTPSRANPVKPAPSFGG